ncbi:MAG: hypothetical protein MK008_10110 [Bdellovibrionales bacterium]|nr:hypothetical protein [Bdellovibrionales bacterium]
MRLLTFGSILALLMVNNYSYAANKCIKLFEERAPKPSSTLTLKKNSPKKDEFQTEKYLKHYSRSDVEFLNDNIRFIKVFEDKGDGKSPHMRMIGLLEEKAAGSFLLMIKNSHIVIEYMIENGFLRDTAQIGRNPRDAIFSSYVKALYYGALKLYQSKTESRSHKIQVQWGKDFINEWANLRGHIFDLVSSNYGTVIYKGNITYFLFQNLKELQVKMELPSVEHQIRLATINDIAQAEKLIGLHLSTIKQIATTSYRVNSSLKVDEMLEAISNIVNRKDREYSENLSFGEKKLLSNILHSLMNLFSKKSPSAQGVEIIERTRVFADELLKQRAYTQAQQEAFKINRPELFKLNVEAFVEKVDQLKIDKKTTSSLVVEYVKKKGSLTEEEYYLLNELNISYKAIDELEVFYSPMGHL